MAFENHIALADRKFLAGSDENLLFHQVYARDLFGDGMLDLNALVDLEEVEVARVVHNELHGASIGVISHLGDGQGCLTHLLAQILEVFSVEQRRGGLLDDLLVAALDGTVPLTQMDDVAPGVAEDLKFDVVRVLDEFLDVYPRITERLFSFRASRVVPLDERYVIVGGPHAATTTAGDGLDHHWIADALGHRQCFLLGLDQAIRTGRRWDFGSLSQIAAAGLIVQRIHGRRTRSDEADVATFADVGEMRVLAQETVARMDGVHIGDLGSRDESVDPKIAVGRGTVSDADGLVGNLDMHRVGVRLGIDGHRFDVHFAAGADDAHGDFTTVGDQDLFKHDRYGNLPVHGSTPSSVPGI